MVQGLNAFSECRQQVFQDRGISDAGEVRKILCTNDEEDEEVSFAHIKKS